jgi:hypothetical protein
MNLSIKERDSRKRKIIISLFTLVIALLIVNLVLEFVWPDEAPKNVNKKEINRTGIDGKFKESLLNLGFENSWIKSKNQKKNKSSSENYLSYDVAVPADLPITVVLNEIFDSFKNYEVEIKSQEQKINGKTLVKIFVGKNLELSAEFYYNKDISRNAGSIGIFIIGINDLKSDELNNLLSIPETFELLLIPSKSSSDILNTLNHYKRGYGILLNDGITDLEFKLNEKYSKGRLKSSIRNILGKFVRASIFMIDDNSNLFSSDVYPLLKEEFIKRKLKLVVEDSLSNLTGESSNSALKNFRNKIEETKKGEKAEFVITSEQFQLLQPEIIKYRRIGYKFLHPSELIKDN